MILDELAHNWHTNFAGLKTSVFLEFRKRSLHPMIWLQTVERIVNISLLEMPRQAAETDLLSSLISVVFRRTAVFEF
jgi:hypothetical protein